MVENTHKPEEFKPIDTPIHYIDSEVSFSQLSDKEALYAFYMTRASWEGAKICYFQRSYESPALMVLFSLVFGDGPALKGDAIAAGVTELEWQQMCVYVAAVFQNCGNFSSFGDKKFVPELTPEKFKAIVKASSAYKTHTSIIDEILTRTEREIFLEEEPLKHIAFPDKNGQTSYYSSNCTSKDADFIDEFC
jgi:dipeptidyl-peptidase-3